MDKANLHPVDRIPNLVLQLYEVVSQLESLFPGRKFTPDGHLVGSIGEVIASYRYGLSLLPASTKTHDATAIDGRKVEVKATQGLSISLRSEPQHLVVLHLNKTGNAVEVYNGPGSVVWAQCGAVQKNGQRSITVSKLRQIMFSVSRAQQLIRLK